nr:uncharacterized protein CI109_002874 [Kwoniella shandongensis]KAA5528716.1 hypothetical protein CI109_002874 [Kwoniella shandongensis]
MASEENRLPATLPHKFELQALADHFDKHTLPPGACALIDLPPDVFLDTEEEINALAASFFTLCVKYDSLPAEERPQSRDHLRRWISRHTFGVVDRIVSKIEPPFAAFNVDQIQKDILGMLDELLTKTLPPPKDTKGEKGKETK